VLNNFKVQLASNIQMHSKQMYCFIFVWSVLFHMLKNYLKSGKIAAILKQDRADEGKDPDGAQNDDSTT